MSDNLKRRVIRAELLHESVACIFERSTPASILEWAQELVLLANTSGHTSPEVDYYSHHNPPAVALYAYRSETEAEYAGRLAKMAFGNIEEERKQEEVDMAGKALYLKLHEKYGK